MSLYIKIHPILLKILLFTVDILLKFKIIITSIKDFEISLFTFFIFTYLNGCLEYRLGYRLVTSLRYLYVRHESFIFVEITPYHILPYTNPKHNNVLYLE